jgi:hypothetical protein
MVKIYQQNDGILGKNLYLWRDLATKFGKSKSKE